MASPTIEKEKLHLSCEEDIQKVVPIVEKTDYSGAHEKTDPKEIALVKKLDRWIMVSISAAMSSHCQFYNSIYSRLLYSPCSGACTG